MKIKIDSDDELPLEETLTLHNVIIFTKLVFNKDQNYYCNIFLEKYSYQLAKKVTTIFFDSVIIFRFGETKVAKVEFYSLKNNENLECWC